LLSSLKEEYEIIVADGGSTDKTLNIARDKNVKIINSSKGRGIQLNAGAKEANGEFLIFLHADTFLPDNAFNLIEEFFADSSRKICRFLLGFDFNHKLLDIYSRFSKYDTQLTRFGDSAIIIRKTFFDELGGFENRETFEDVEFLKRASRFGRIYILNAKVISSSRRFIQNGIIKKQLINILIFIGYLLNVNSQTLSRMFNRKLKTRTDSIIIFVRYPRKGQVKTRLAETTSSDFAINFYKLCAENLIRNIKKVPSVNRFVFYSNKNEKTETINWLGSKLLFAPQDGDDLGNRMKNAFQKVFSAGSQKVIIVGTDIPDLSKEVIVKAFELLDSNDVVIGPAKDGGYYLLGMKKMTVDLFEKIEYSTSSVLSETLLKTKKLNLTYHLLTELKDIDTEEDLVNWLNHDYSNPIKRKVKLAYKPA
jgi:rSAM/selenodomain-associated transferase 1/rSAM/selenodomain-associated transferase 2